MKCPMTKEECMKEAVEIFEEMSKYSKLKTLKKNV